MRDEVNGDGYGDGRWFPAGGDGDESVRRFSDGECNIGVSH